jgi:hypothetical protein
LFRKDLGWATVHEHAEGMSAEIRTLMKFSRTPAPIRAALSLGEVFETIPKLLTARRG